MRPPSPLYQATAATAAPPAVADYATKVQLSGDALPRNPMAEPARLQALLDRHAHRGQCPHSNTVSSLAVLSNARRNSIAQPVRECGHLPRWRSVNVGTDPDGAARSWQSGANLVLTAELDT
jgi:hypothetical protein